MSHRLTMDYAALARGIASAVPDLDLPRLGVELLRIEVEQARDRLAALLRRPCRLRYEFYWDNQEGVSLRCSRLYIGPTDRTGIETRIGEMGPEGVDNTVLLYLAGALDRPDLTHLNDAGKEAEWLPQAWDGIEADLDDAAELYLSLCLDLMAREGDQLDAGDLDVFPGSAHVPGSGAHPLRVLVLDAERASIVARALAEAAP